MFDRFRKSLIATIGVIMCLYTLVAVNFTVFQPESSKALFVLFGMALCFLAFPLHERLEKNTPLRIVDFGLALLSVFCFGHIFVQNEPIPWFQNFWPDGLSLSNRAGDETSFDFAVGLIGLGLVFEATRRSIGWIVPALAALFVAHSYYCHLSNNFTGYAEMPEWMFPHAGQSVEQIVSVTFLQSLGVLGPAADVMFRYVFLFVVFGAFLELSGATQFIIDFAERVFGRSPGGPAKVSVLGSGLMGSLSGSAVANAVTTGSFTIPMMRNTGFSAPVAGGITAAAASGGALVPPVMGAGAYMMIEFARRGDQQIDFLEIARAALVPAALYYFSLFMIVHFFAKKVGAGGSVDDDADEGPEQPIWRFEGLIFFGALGILVALLGIGFSPFKAVTGSLVLILVATAFRKNVAIDKRSRMIGFGVFLAVAAIHQFITESQFGPMLNQLPENWIWIRGYTRPFLAAGWTNPVTGNFDFWAALESVLGSSILGALGMLAFGLIDGQWRPLVRTAFAKAARNGISLVAASACVGIIIGIVQSTPVAQEFSEAIKDVVESSLLLALIGIMICSIVLGMGVPSVVCYLLMATLMGSLLGELGVDPLAAHLFIFYYGMMSMVTPPVALAAYASASIAEAKVMPTALAAFRFSLVGFTLPFMFVYRPELLLMKPSGQVIGLAELPYAVVIIAAAFAGVLALAGAVTGQFFRGPLSAWQRVVLCAAAIVLLMPTLKIGETEYGWVLNVLGVALLIVGIVTDRKAVPTPSVSGKA